MKATGRKQGFTLVEVMVTMLLSFLVLTTLYVVYHWSAELVTLCGKKNRSQVAAINSSVRIMDCIRNASEISGIDPNGYWVELTYPTGDTAVLACTNSPLSTNGTALGLFRDGEDPVWFVKNGITKVMSQGNSIVVFCTNTTDKLYVNYRVSQPAGSGGRDLSDENYAMHVRFAACLRNAN
jgi:prepilin-type N-terminal cleavage/methylation domain-containing protein